MQDFNTKPWAVVRWITLFPVALAASFLMLITQVAWLSFVMSDSLFRTIILQTVPQLFMGGAFIYVGTLMAPARKNWVAIILFIVGILYCLFGFAAEVLVTHGGWKEHLQGASLLVGMIVSFLQAREHGRQNEPEELS